MDSVLHMIMTTEDLGARPGVEGEGERDCTGGLKVTKR